MAKNSFGGETTFKHNNIKNTYKQFSSQNLDEEFMIDILLYGCDRFNERGNKEILSRIK